MFSGCGLLDLGLERAGMTPRWFAETDKACNRVLARHWPHVPNLGDVTAVDWSTVEPVDVLCGGGWPCQPFSSAGLQLGESDDRYQWPEVARALRVLRPRVFVMEQSPNLLARKFRDVWLRCLSDLAELGFDAKWTVLRASDVGAPHARRRLFLAAYADGCGQQWARAGARRLRDERHDAPRRDLAVAHANRATRRQITGSTPRDEATHAGGGPDATDLARGCAEAPPDTEGTGLAWPAEWPECGRGPLAAWDRYGPAIQRWERITGERAPDALDDRGRMNALLPLWMMGGPRGFLDGESRTAQIRLAGNAVVVQVGELVGRWALAGLDS